MVPAIEMIIPRVMKKNFLPDKATQSFWICWENLCVPLNQPSFGIVRKILSGLFDSSWIEDAMKNNADVRAIKKIVEYQ